MISLDRTAHLFVFIASLTRRTLGVLFTAALLGACGFGGQMRVGPVSKMLKQQPDLCGAAALIDTVGQPFVVLADHKLVGQLRVLWPGQEITDEVVPDRLNAEVTHDQLILRLSCG